MTSAYSRERQSLPLSRRRLLGLLGGAGATALLAACGNGGASTATAPATSGVSGGSVPSPVPTTTATPVASTVTTITATKAAPPTGGAAGGASTRTTGTAVGSPAASPNASGEITIVESGATLPTGQVTFHWVDSGDAKAPFNKAFFAAYQRKHPTITIQYDPLPQAEINKVVLLGVQNGNAPDAFAMPQVVQGAQAVQQGWVAPLDDIVPNFARWKAAFPPGAFVSGITDFNGKTYTVPFTSNQRYSTLTLFNTAYLQQAGYDPAAKPLTWDEFRAAAKKITQQGAGKYYGVLLEANQTSRLAVFVNSLAQMAGALGSGGGDVSDINLKTGEFNFTTDQYLAVIELLLALKGDSSVFPGSTSLNAAQARAQFPNGVAGLILQGPWNIPGWQQDNPDFTFGVGSQPVPNSGMPLPITYGPGGGQPGVGLGEESEQGDHGGSALQHGNPGESGRARRQRRGRRSAHLPASRPVSGHRPGLAPGANALRSADAPRTRSGGPQRRCRPGLPGTQEGHAGLRPDGPGSLHRPAQGSQSGDAGSPGSLEQGIGPGDQGGAGQGGEGLARRLEIRQLGSDEGLHPGRLRRREVSAATASGRKMPHFL